MAGSHSVIEGDFCDKTRVHGLVMDGLFVVQQEQQFIELVSVCGRTGTICD